MADSEKRPVPRLKGKIIISGDLKVVTGLHIGGNAAGSEIGDLDKPVIRDPITQLPFIPGSSLKGKLRAELEWLLGKVESDGNPSTAEEIVRIFGSAADKSGAPMGRLTVRDAYPEGYDRLDLAKPLELHDDKDLSPTLRMWKQIESGLRFTEWKMENSLNRITSRANPRSFERVPAGSVFRFEMVYTVYDSPKEAEGFEHLLRAMKALEDSYLGGSGTRGYGKIVFKKFAFRLRPLAYYLTGQGEEIVEFPSVREGGEKAADLVGRLVG